MISGAIGLTGQARGTATPMRMKLPGVAAGDNRKVKIVGEKACGDIEYQEEKTGIRVIAGRTTGTREIVISALPLIRASSYGGAGYDYAGSTPKTSDGGIS